MSSAENLYRVTDPIYTDACLKQVSGLRSRPGLSGKQVEAAPSTPSPCLLLNQHILYCIVDSECKSRDVLQSYFDLLGELMKFNVDAFKRFNKYINTEAKVRLTQGLHGVCCSISYL